MSNLVTFQSGKRESHSFYLKNNPWRVLPDNSQKIFPLITSSEKELIKSSKKAQELYVKYALDLTVGYEMRVWFSENQTLLGRTSEIITERSLSLQGLTASIKLDF